MRLIDADRLLTEQAKRYYYHLENGDTAIPIIDIVHAPTVADDVGVVVRGRWNFVGDDMHRCTACGELYTTRQLRGLQNRTTDPIFPKFCPNCGAKMSE